jgi:hypothetical protein
MATKFLFCDARGGFDDFTAGTIDGIVDCCLAFFSAVFASDLAIKEGGGKFSRASGCE